MCARISSTFWFDRPRSWDADHIAFVEHVAASVYGTGMSRQEIDALAEQLESRWAADIAANYEEDDDGDGLDVTVHSIG